MLGVLFSVRNMRVREGIGKPRIRAKFFGGNIIILRAILFLAGSLLFVNNVNC